MGLHSINVSFWRYILFLCLERILLFLHFLVSLCQCCTLNKMVIFIPHILAWYKKTSSPISLFSFFLATSKHLEYAGSHKYSMTGETEAGSSDISQKCVFLDAFSNCFPFQGEAVVCFCLFVFAYFLSTELRAVAVMTWDKTVFAVLTGP